MDPIDKFEESMKVLDILSLFINKESENFVKCDEIREPLEKAFKDIYDIYQHYGDAELEEELRDKWEKYNDDDDDDDNDDDDDLLT